MAATRKRVSTAGVCRALFPGSFKPPHRGHFESVQSLLARPEVDEVVIVISNRCRILPQTGLAIDAETARSIWHLYLTDITGVRVVIAEHTAIEHALTYFDHSCAGDRLLFCIGRSDLAAGDDRFTEIDRLSRESGVAASVVTTQTKIRSTDLRRMLAAGDAGRGKFLTRLPDHLSASDRDTVWSTCRNRLRTVTDVFLEKITPVLHSRDIDIRGPLRAIDAQTVDPEFALTTSCGTELIVKYAGDTVGSGSYTGPLEQKPRQRLAAERRTLKHLAALNSGQYALPQVVFFDKRTRTLALTGFGESTAPLAMQIDRFVTDQRIAEQIGRFLAELHSMPLPENPLRGAARAETDHWNAILRGCVRLIESRIVSSAAKKTWLTSIAGSADIVLRHVVHLDFCPENIWLAGEKLGVSRFERSSSHGDPAYDLGTIIGHFFAHAQRTGHVDFCAANVGYLLRVYRDNVIGADAERLERAMTFASITSIRLSGRQISAAQVIRLLTECI